MSPAVSLAAGAAALVLWLVLILALPTIGPMANLLLAAGTTLLVRWWALSR